MTLETYPKHLESFAGLNTELENIDSDEGNTPQVPFTRTTH